MNLIFRLMKKCLLPKLLSLIVISLVTIKSYSQNYTQASNWTIVSPSSTSMVENVVTVNEGIKSAKITWTNTSLQIIDSDPISTTGNASYSFSIKYYDDNNWAGTVKALIFFNDGTYQESLPSADLNSWQTFGFTGTVPAAATSVYASIRFDDDLGFGGSAVVYIDKAIYTENDGANLISNGGFETWEIIDPDPPVWTATFPKITNITTSTCDLTVNTNEEGMAYYAVLADLSTTPTSEEVKAGTGAIVSGNISIPTLGTDFTKKISGLTNNINYDIYVVAEDDEANPNLQANPVLIEILTESAIPEPTNHVTSFTASTNSYNSIDLTWTDATGAQLPEGYLIKASTGSITAPNDFIDPAEDIDLSDGSAIVKVYHGTQKHTFTGLSAATSYNFQIWSFTNGGDVIDYKTNVSGPASNSTTANSELFFSEYVEGTAGNTALEIYNPTGSSVNLSNYKLLGSTDGGDWATNSSVVLPNTTLAAGDVFIIARTDANQTILDKADLTYSDGPSYEMSFTGNDARALAVTADGGTSWNIVDIIGEKDVNPGTGWNVAVTNTATANHTLIRKTGSVTGNVNWTNSAGTTNGNSEWIVMPLDYFNNLGAYRIINNDATLSALTYDGTSVTGFSSNVYTYNQELAFDSSLPTVEAIANDATYATIIINQAQNLIGTIAERTATVTITADDLSTIDYTIVFSLGSELSDNATVTSTDYNVDNTTETITGIPYGTTLDEFKSNLTPANGASFNVYENDGITVASGLITGYKLIVTAEDATTKTYTITVIDANSETTITSMQYTISHASSTISDVPNGTSLETFESNITPATGATFETYEADGSTVATNLASDYKVIVTAEDETTTKTYTVLITTGTTDILNNINFKLYPNPSNGIFKLELNNFNNEEFIVDIYNTIGKIIYTTTLSKKETIIDLSEMNKGVYFASIKKEGINKVSKIIIH